MKKNQEIRFQFPIFHWLFLLFLASGISDFREIPKQIFRIESVSHSSKESGQRTEPVRHTGFSDLHFHTRNKFALAEIIRQFSSVLSISIKTFFKDQLFVISCLVHNTLLHFRNCNLNFRLSQHIPDFISRAEHC